MGKRKPRKKVFGLNDDVTSADQHGPEALCCESAALRRCGVAALSAAEVCREGSASASL